MADEQASRDLCLAVARALGWRVTFDEPPAWPEGIEPGTQTEYVEYIPHFDDRIEAAWRIVERLRKHGLHLDLHEDERAWWARFVRWDAPGAATKPSFRGDSAAAAICRACLALGDSSPPPTLFAAEDAA